MTDTGLTIRRKRLLWRAMHRGTREMDLLLGGYARAHLESMSDGDLDQLEAVVATPDPDIMSWMMGESAVPAANDTPVLRAVLAFRP